MYNVQTSLYEAAAMDFVGKGYAVRTLLVVFQKNFFNIVKLFELSLDKRTSGNKILSKWINNFTVTKEYDFDNIEYINNLYGEEII